MDPCSTAPAVRILSLRQSSHDRTRTLHPLPERPPAALLGDPARCMDLLLRAVLHHQLPERRTSAGGRKGHPAGARHQHLGQPSLPPLHPAQPVALPRHRPCAASDGTHRAAAGIARFADRDQPARPVPARLQTAALRTTGGAPQPRHQLGAAPVDLVTGLLRLLLFHAEPA